MGPLGASHRAPMNARPRCPFPLSVRAFGARRQAVVMGTNSPCTHGLATQPHYNSLTCRRKCWTTEVQSETQRVDGVGQATVPQGIGGGGVPGPSPDTGDPFR